MNEIRTSGISLFDFVFNNKSGIGNAEYSNLYVFNFLRYIAVNISDNNFLLSAFCVFVNYMIIGWIIVDWEGLSEAKASISMTALLVLGAFSRVGAMFSNIRYPLASSLSVLAIYLYLCKKKPLYIYIILMALAMFVHPGVIMTIPIVVLSVFSFKNIIVEYISVFVITMLSNWISRLFANAGNSYLQIIGRLYISYTSEEQYRGSRYGFYGSILIFIILIAIYLLQRNSIMSSSKISEGQKSLYEFICLYMVYSLANGGSYVLLTRIASTIGMFAPVLMTLISDYKGWELVPINARYKSLIRVGTYICFMILILYMNTKGTIEFTPYII